MGLFLVVNIIMQEEKDYCLKDYGLGVQILITYGKAISETGNTAKCLTASVP